MENFYSDLNSAIIKTPKTDILIILGEFNARQNGLPPIFSADENKFLTDKKDILVRWAEEFRTVLNCPSSISAEAIARLKQVPIKHSLADPPRLNEVMTAISNLSTGKAPELDFIPA
ncbi:hypothetical protein BgiBS90_032297 [Biomphalaria glabrata]|nr:hypothetical protein BgiBS90_032297 [Biomphalaria glabrata]